MEKTLSPEIIEEVLDARFPITDRFQPCSFINPKGKFLVLDREHYEAFKWLVVEQLVQCIPDAEELLNELGYIRFSYIGYITLSDKEPTKAQYQALEYTLLEIQKYRRVISLQIANQPKFYLDVDLENNVDKVIKAIKAYYKKGELRI